MNLIRNNITLRAVELSDADFLKNMINNPEIEQNVIGWSAPVNNETQMEWINSIQKNTKNIRYIIEIDNKTVGLAIISNIDFKNSNASVEMKLEKTSRGKGYGTKVYQMLLDYCFFELNLYCITAVTLQENIAQQKVLEKLGFNRDGILRDRVFKKGKYHNLICYSILTIEYNQHFENLI